MDLPPTIHEVPYYTGQAVISLPYIEKPEPARRGMRELLMKQYPELFYVSPLQRSLTGA